MKIISALFVDEIQTRQVDGPSTRLDLSGVQFSAVAEGPLPVTITPHLVVVVWNPPGGKDFAALEVTYSFANATEVEPVARNMQPLQIEPGKFNYRLVRAELEFDAHATVVASCKIDDGPATQVPFTLLKPESN